MDKRTQLVIDAFRIAAESTPREEELDGLEDPTPVPYGAWILQVLDKAKELWKILGISTVEPVPLKDTHDASFRMTHSTDARDWATAFMRLCAGDGTFPDLSHDMLVTWFSSAIDRGVKLGRSEVLAELEEQETFTYRAGGGVPTNSSLALVMLERRRQIEAGYDAEHDDRHTNGELVEAAMHLLTRGDDSVDDRGTLLPWPWEATGDAPTVGSREEELAMVAALVVAEIERLRRLR